MSISSANNGKLWISSTQGITYIDQESDRLTNYDFHNRQNYNQFNRGASIIGPENEFLAGGIYGINSINGVHADSESASANLLITDILISGQSILAHSYDGLISDLKHVDLSTSEKSLEFRFSNYLYNTSSSSHFQYKLDPYNDDWVSLSVGDNKVVFQNVPWGDYTFYVRDNLDIISIEVYIEPPIWLRWWFVLGLLLLILLLAYTYWRFVTRRKKDEQARLLIEAEREILSLKNKTLENSVIASNTKLLSSTAQMAHKNEVLTSVRQTLKDQLKSDKLDLYRIIRLLDLELANEDYWEEFNIYFESVDQEFIRKLNSNYKNLTQNDIRLCALLRLNLNTKEIASLLNISTRGVEKARSRLKKRMELGKEINLQSFIKSY